MKPTDIAKVALLAEGVDRNRRKGSGLSYCHVALLAEGVDRNGHWEMDSVESCQVALLAEGVDRNPLIFQSITCDNGSPSSRRAWIEIGQPEGSAAENEVALLAEGVDRNLAAGDGEVVAVAVALLAEGVDRNPTSSTTALSAGWSPSSRRAWIEILTLTLPAAKQTGRPPRGGRG